MEYLAEIKRSLCLKEFFEFVFRTDVESAYKQLRDYDVLFEFEYNPVSLDCRTFQTDFIDHISISKQFERDPIISAISYARTRIQVFVYIHSTLDNTPNLYMRFFRSDSFDIVEQMVNGISAFAIVKCSHLILNNIPCKSYDMMNMSLTWVSNVLAYDVMYDIEEYAMETNQFDVLFDLCNSRDDVYLKAALLNAHNRHQNSCESKSIQL